MPGDREGVPVGSGEAFLRALGADAALLHPEIAAQMRTPASRARGEGVFARAGSRYRLLNALAMPLLGRDAVVTRIASDVPFSVLTESAVTTVTVGDAAIERVTLRTTREFRFPSGAQRVSDVMTTSVHPGLVRTLLGERGRVELIEECAVGDGGTLRMRTRRAALRLGGRRIALRGILAVHVDVEDGWDDDNARRTIAVTVRNPLAGTLLEYRGWYRYSSVEDQ
ncbi:MULTISPECIES: DUF4166 domain-containing protein [Microbacterium]|uniref:DUF4166 domain-containing protein n=1 Tax=Microbacterium TaxID=33882 RepID=UPI0011B02B43|nr:MULTISPECIES: DUF4166 domain-containing protein [unclassified Microbacterium]